MVFKSSSKDGNTIVIENWKHTGDFTRYFQKDLIIFCRLLEKDTTEIIRYMTAIEMQKKKS